MIVGVERREMGVDDGKVDSRICGSGVVDGKKAFSW